MAKRRAPEVAVVQDMSGRWVRGADGLVYRVTMRGECVDPWGRVGGVGEVAEIPRPFRATDPPKEERP